MSMSPEIEGYWKQLGCRFPVVAEVFEDCMHEALRHFSPAGIKTFLEQARFLARIGHGPDPVLVYLEEAPVIASDVGEAVFPEIMACIQKLFRSPNGAAIVPFLQTLAAAARRLHSSGQMKHYLELVVELMDRSSVSIHGHHQIMASPALPEFLKQVPVLVSNLSMEGIRHWVEYGLHSYADHPERQKDYFSLQSADARAMFQKERHGTLLMDHERKLDLYLRGLWRIETRFLPYSLAFSEIRQPIPYFDHLGIRIPDVYDDLNGVSGLDRYRLALAHMAAHQSYSECMIADNWSPFQRIAVEALEDIRVDYLLLQCFPGLRKRLLSLHPIPLEADLALENISLIWVRMTMLSRAILDPECHYQDPHIQEFAQRFYTLMATGASTSLEMADLALLFHARTKTDQDLSNNIHLENTVVSYRDDNRHLWRFIEQDEAEGGRENTQQEDEETEAHGLPPRHYDEWDYLSQMYHPDWVSVYESIHPAGQASRIDALLEKHAALAKRLKRMLDLLKPQDKVRIRFQEEGTDLDLDVAVRSLIDFKAGAQPDPRINMSHRTDGRDIAVLLLLDLSQSLNEKAAGSTQSILELSQEAVSLLAWSVDQIGDPLAIAGFHSNTRHEVRYHHIKGFSESWGATVKARLSAMEASWSTRMGAAMRHAAHYLAAQQADKKLLLILTDGEPADVDSKDERALIEDAHKAVQELDQQGIYSYCINLDSRADAYVADIFGHQYTIIDHIERLPERLPQLFISLTK